ncbi:hypothetical protein FNV43_RR05693 [Rhamnella rubrinervis]|uniref:DUF1985 domain-containing protein n=1 Tax=Rhamnella rubrinervis TaxID=2594499 RepID=A0A8K0HML5_9ROSA|nr:hypothetical protein FNV43_RR05693 [Rhamnella rubrinervis]
MEDDDMVKLSLLYIMECGILEKESHNNIKMDHVSLVEDLHTFNTYPWGKEAWEATKNALYKALDKHKFSRTYSLGRCPLTFQVWGYEAIHKLRSIGEGEDDMLTTSELDHNAHHYARSTDKKAADKGENIPKYIIPPSMEDEDVIYEEYVNKEEVVNKEEIEVEAKHQINKEEDEVVNKEESEAINEEEKEKENKAAIKEDNEDVNMEEKENEAATKEDNEDVNMEKENEATTKDNEDVNMEENEVVNNQDNKDVNKEDKTNKTTNEDKFETVNKDDNVNNIEDTEATVKAMVENKDTDQTGSIVQSTVMSTIDTATHVQVDEKKNEELNIGVLGYKRLRRKGAKMKSPYVVHKELKDRLKNTLPANHFNPMKQPTDHVVKSFAAYMLKDPSKVVSLSEYEPITIEFMEVMVKTAEWLTDVRRLRCVHAQIHGILDGQSSTDIQPI